MTSTNWVDLSRDPETGIESLRAHFEGHAYDPHWHDTYAIGLTEQGVQRFHLGRTRHESTPGKVILLEPGDVHDGHGPTPEGFTYRLLYIDPQWLHQRLGGLFEQRPDHYRMAFQDAMSSDVRLARAIGTAFDVMHHGDFRITRQAALDTLLERLTCHVQWRRRPQPHPAMPLLAAKTREFLHAHIAEDIGMDDVARALGCDRFRITRAFKAAFGMSPHAYLVQLRLVEARRLLARGETPAEVAAATGFADQSHLGRWFRRAYAMTPAYYRNRCSKLPD
ncbi:AraC family transcriptional regulator [Alloalcanivorax xenomutans]|jgi:AraC-like DNA-binding protein|uniref:AraC family transcriptional regulator n=1 Tax=Alloalcanivorax xenomutans TaxID=1094342 RepID=A0A9Q3W6T6_9GAMM|nr:AraC family transcriptional regulator [Alloalcanivorax xenomutans]ERS13628.1 AraC family transcriptional regulator [Alcanivorax sp. PN-3]KYZ84771.1 AraC family transcriptional regulator [Alcanivorax sp. KX64203]MBA4721581.1 AraC family transcriptional regulator [Alcanivorax sp.]ARB45086.1 AraC family transcriptional regulator [Alloalcanivorax xenomutans]MCE7509093.1 AraC family transcriptional regulator [Alloalcanivorax xenomutans]